MNLDKFTTWFIKVSWFISLGLSVYFVINLELVNMWIAIAFMWIFQIGVKVQIMGGGRSK